MTGLVAVTPVLSAQQKMEGSTATQRLHFRLYVSYIEASREQLQRVNKQAYYRISVWDNDKLLGEMPEGSTPAILAEKVFLTRAAINFSQRMEGRHIVLKLTEYYVGETLLGIGMFDLQPVRQKYLQQSQRFNSLLEATLNTATSSYKLVFSLFVERDKYALDGYIKRFKENEKDVMRAKRNINNYKKEMINKSIEREAALARGREEAKNNAKERRIESQGKDKMTPTIHVMGPSKQSTISGTPELQINSAARFHPKPAKPLKERKPLNEVEEKEFEAYSTIMEQYNANSHFISALDMEAPSMISDGSEESEMRVHHERETYSEKAIKKFRGNVNILLNVLMVIVGILLISFVITPSRKYTKGEASRRKHRKDEMELFDI